MKPILRERDQDNEVIRKNGYEKKQTFEVLPEFRTVSSQIKKLQQKFGTSLYGLPLSSRPHIEKGQWVTYIEIRDEHSGVCQRQICLHLFNTQVLFTIIQLSIKQLTITCSKIVSILAVMQSKVLGTFHY